MVADFLKGNGKEKEGWGVWDRRHSLFNLVSEIDMTLFVIHAIGPAACHWQIGKYDYWKMEHHWLPPWKMAPIRMDCEENGFILFTTLRFKAVTS